jgi:hypothetical protein
MFEPKNIFQKISYLQYPAMLIALFYIFKPYVVGFDTIWENYNFALIFMGLGISLSTLQDTTKTQNELSRKVWVDPKKGKIAIMIITCFAAFLIFLGLYGVYLSSNEILEQLSFGTIVLGIGAIGLLKTAIEMFENHRSDKNSRQSEA